MNDFESFLFCQFWLNFFAEKEKRSSQITEENETNFVPSAQIVQTVKVIQTVNLSLTNEEEKYLNFLDEIFYDKSNKYYYSIFHNHPGKSWILSIILFWFSNFNFFKMKSEILDVIFT